MKFRPIDPRLLTESWMKQKFFPHAKVVEGGCVEWTAGKNSAGYGVAYLRDGYGLFTHRIAVVWATGQDIEPGLVVDHLCRNRACVNVSHLEVTTASQNIRRGNTGKFDRWPGGRCKRGHDVTLPGATTKPKPRKGQKPLINCRECLNLAYRRYYQKKKLHDLGA